MDFIEQYSSDSLLLIGEGGIGKTTTLFHVLEAYTKGDIELKGQIPLYIELNKCPHEMDTWRINDKTSVFIEKYIAKLLLGGKDVDKNDSIVSRIQREFAKEPETGIPQYLLLLDGLNEVSTGNFDGYSVRKVLEDEISQAILIYKNVRFIITSRNDALRLKPVKRIKISGVSKAGIESYLNGEEVRGKIKKGTVDRVLNNKDLLDCLRIPLFLNMYGVISDGLEITTRGEILRDFFQKKRETLYSEQIEGNEWNSFILDFIVPEIAWEMVKREVFSISFEEIEAIVSRLIKDKVKSVPLNKDCAACFGLQNAPYRVCIKLMKIETGELITEMLWAAANNLAVMYKDEGEEYKFRHHHFRDYFSALSIIQKAKLEVFLFNKRYGKKQPFSYLEDIKFYKLNQHTIQFISESLGRHHCNPQYMERKGWMRYELSGEKDLVAQLLHIFRGRFKLSDIGWSVWNIVEIMAASGMGLLGCDLSDLNLTNINFNGKLCGNHRNFTDYATKFENSILDLNQFLPMSHCEVIKNAGYSSNGELLFTASDLEVIIWNANYDYIAKLKLEKRIKKTIFSEEGNHIICSMDDGGIAVWNIWTNQFKNIDGKGEEISDICSATNKDYIYVAWKKGIIKRFYFKECSWSEQQIRIGKNIDNIYFNKKCDKIIVKTEYGELLYGDEVYRHFSKLFNSVVKDFSQNESGEILGIVTKEGFVKIGDFDERKWEDITHPGKNADFIKFTPDGKNLGIVEGGHTLRVLNLEEESFKRPLQCEKEITDITFSNDSKYAITVAGDIFAKIWEIKSDVGICIKPLGDIADWIRNAYYSPDGMHIATSSIDTTGKIWDIKSGELISILYGHDDRVTSVLYSHDGKKVVTTSDDYTTRIWNEKEAGCLNILKNNDNSVHNAALDKADGLLGTVSWDKTGTIWNLQDKSVQPIKLEGHKAPLLTILFDTSDEFLITSSNDNTAIVWDARTGENMGIYAEHEDRLNSAAFSPDGRYIITSSFDKTAKIWDRQQKKKLVKSLDGHTDSVRSAAFSPDGNFIITVSRDMTAKLWDGHTFEHKKDLIGHTFFVRSAMFSENSQKILTASYDGSVKEWDLEGTCLNTIRSIPGLFVCGCDFKNLNSSCHITPEQRTIFIAHGARLD